MTEKYQTAFMLLAVGMITVFIILFMLVVLSKLMILVINKYFPSYEKNDKYFFEKPNELINPQQLSAIIAAVDIITKGTGQVHTINKIKK